MVASPLLLCLSACAAASSDPGAAASSLLPRLLGNGTDAEFLSLFAAGATIDDVFEGRVGGHAGRADGQAALLRFRSAFAARLAPTRPDHSGGAGGLALLRMTRDGSAPRVAVEQLLQLGNGHAWDACAGAGRANASTELLVTTVVEHATSADGTGGTLITGARLYYPAYPLTGGGTDRPRTLPSNASAATAGAVAVYQAALRAGDAEAVAGTFEPDGYFREPSGAYHAGARSGVLDNFRTFFGLGGGGGIDLEHCAVTSDGVAYVLEYVCVGWGSEALPPTAGAATYELGRSGRIMGARVNDNVQPPAAHRAAV